MKYMVLTLLTAALGIAACKPKDNTPPEPEEYFNCEINGKYWTYQADMSGFNPCSGIGAGPNGLTSWGLGARDCKGKPKISITIFISGGNSFPDRDTFELGNQHFAEIYKPYKIDSGQYWSFMTDAQHTGKLIFTQRDSSWVKGLFYFDVLDKSLNQVVHITNGKFSIKL